MRKMAGTFPHALRSLWWLVAAATLGSATALSQTDLSALTGDAEKGRAQYHSFGCYACHGFTGETGQTGVQLNPPRLPQVAFITYVRNPPLVSTGNFRMPAYGGDIVTDQSLADIYAFLESLPSGTPPLDDIELLRDE